MSRKLKSGWHELKSGHCKPINKQASHGLTGGHSTSRDEIEPIPANTKPPIMTLDQFRIRHGLEYADAQRKYRDYLNIFEPKPVKENRSSVHNPSTAVVVWNADAEKQVRETIARGASLPKALMKSAPKGFVGELRKARTAERINRPNGDWVNEILMRSSKQAGKPDAQ